ncbi:hypothetical protein CRYUN_Cryun06bG0063800 [Craigia yunnanensis]
MKQLPQFEKDLARERHDAEESGEIKPKVGTVCFGVAASQGALLLAGGVKGMRYAMPNPRIMIHPPQSGCGAMEFELMDGVLDTEY